MACLDRRLALLHSSVVQSTTSPSVISGVIGTSGKDVFPYKSLFAASFLLLGSLASIFLAGGPMQGGIGIFLLTAGAVLLLTPPLHVTSWGWWGLGALIVMAASSAMLPAEWVGSPGWRDGLLKIPALLLPQHVSLDPRATVFWILLLATSILLGLFLLGVPLSPRGMEQAALLAVLGCSVYAVVAWLSWQTEWRYPLFQQEFWMQPSYGFFQNRNQTAGFLLTGAILSLGLIYRGVTGGRLLSCLIASGSFALLVSMLLVFSKSRGGVVFLIVGLGLWMAGLGRHRSRWLVVCAALLGLIITLLFFTSGSELLDRLRGQSPIVPATTMTPAAAGATARPPGDSSPFSDARIAIWRDTFSMIGDFPATGTGLGSYHLVYPFYAGKSLRDRTTALHAESDWLTLCSEAGIPALLLVMGGVAVLARRIPKLKLASGKDWPVRWAFLSAFFAEILHGMVDVPLHKPELGWWILLLGGIGFASRCGEVEPRRWTLKCQRGFFLLGGIGMIVMGCMMIKAQWWGGESLPPYAPAAEEAKIMKLFGAGGKVSLEQSMAECRAAIRKYPLDASLYFQLGVLLLDLGQTPDQSLSLFAVENSLSPHDPLAPLRQGKLLIPVDPLAAALLLKEAIVRQLFLDHLPTSPMARSTEMLQDILAASARSPQLLERMPELSMLDPKLQLVWLFNPACSPTVIAASVKDASFMDTLDARMQGRLIQRWYERVGKAEVEAFLETHQSYSRAAIATRAAITASSGNHEAACQLLSDAFALGVTQRDVSDSSMIHSPESHVPPEPLAAAKYYFERGNTVAARRLLEEAMKKGDGRQEDMFFLKTRLNVRAGNWKDAYESLLGYLRVTGRL